MASWRPLSSRSASACPPQAARGLVPILFPALGNGTETLTSLEEVNQTGNKPTWVCGHKPAGQVDVQEPNIGLLVGEQQGYSKEQNEHDLDVFEEILFRKVICY